MVVGGPHTPRVPHTPKGDLLGQLCATPLRVRQGRGRGEVTHPAVSGRRSSIGNFRKYLEILKGGCESQNGIFRRVHGSVDRRGNSQIHK